MYKVMQIKAQSQKHAWAYCWQTQMSFFVLYPHSQGAKNPLKGPRVFKLLAWVIDSSSWPIITSTPQHSTLWNFVFFPFHQQGLVKVHTSQALQVN